MAHFVWNWPGLFLFNLDFFYSFLSRFEGAADPLPAPDPAAAASTGVPGALNDGVAPDYKGTPSRVSVVVVAFVVVSSHIFKKHHYHHHYHQTIVISIINSRINVYIETSVLTKTSVVATLSAYKAFCTSFICHHYCTYSLAFLCSFMNTYISFRCTESHALTNPSIKRNTS